MTTGWRRVGLFRMWGGWTDLGRVRIPPLPVGVVLTDRSSGTEYLLSHTSGGAVDLVTPVPSAWRGRVQGPYDGPVVQSAAGPLRLYVEGGVLGYELGPEGANQGRVLTRSYTDYSTVYELEPGDGWAYGDSLTLTQVLPEED